MLFSFFRWHWKQPNIHSNIWFSKRTPRDSIKSYPSLLILFFKTNINPTEYDPGAFKSMNAWIPALSTAFQHSIQNLFFLLFYFRQSGNTWPQRVFIIFTTILLPFFSLVQVYASELVNSISVFLSAAAKMDAAAQLQRDKREGG